MSTIILKLAVIILAMAVAYFAVRIIMIDTNKEEKYKDEDNRL
jgi:hypothetical protein